MPFELKMLNRIRRFGDPWGGGWMAWPAGLIDRISAAETVYNVMVEWWSIKAQDKSDWVNANPDKFKVYLQVRDIMTSDHTET